MPSPLYAGLVPQVTDAKRKKETNKAIETDHVKDFLLLLCPDDAAETEDGDELLAFL